MVIAMDLEGVLLAAGVAEVDSASGVDDALRLIDRHLPDFAVLDINLGQETSFPVAQRLLDTGVRFAFGTGYGEEADLPDALRGTPVLKKPYAADQVVAMVRGRGK